MMQIIHWFGYLVTVYLVFVLSSTDTGRLNNVDVGLVALLILSFATFCAGITASWRISVVGVFLGIAVVAIALFEEYIWVVLIPLALIIIGAFLFRHRKSKERRGLAVGNKAELLKVDKEICKKDGICAAECPMAIIEMDHGEGYPRLIPGTELVCLRCGHCIAVCPHGALQHASIPMDRCPTIIEDLAISREQAVQFLRSRRSVRIYRDKPVEKEKVAELIEIARYAPTAGNRQMVHWLVITDGDKIHRLAELTIDWMRWLLENAPEAARPPYFHPW